MPETPFRNTQAPIENVHAAILFFDVKGYSKLSFEARLEYHTTISHELASIINSISGYKYKKTWGDGLVLVHHDLFELALIALKLNKYFAEADYEKNATVIRALGIELRARIALHFGEIHTFNDEIDGFPGCFGEGMIWAARIEPVVSTERVWATFGAVDALYKLKKVLKSKRIFWKRLGLKQLAKEFDEIDIWEVMPRGQGGNKVKPVETTCNTTGREDIPDDEGSPPDGTGDEPPDYGPKEPYEEISLEAAERIEVLTGENPIKNQVDICSNRYPEPCPAKAVNLDLLSIFLRNAVSSTFDNQIATSFKTIDAMARIIIEIEGSATVESHHFLQLYFEISCLIGEFKYLRNNDTLFNEQSVLYEYLELRCNLHDFMIYTPVLNSIMAYYNTPVIPTGKTTAETTKAISKDLDNKSDELINYTEVIMGKAKSISDHLLAISKNKRVGIIKEAVTKMKFNRTNLSGSLKPLIVQLTKWDRDKIPRNWR